MSTSAPVSVVLASDWVAIVCVVAFIVVSRKVGARRYGACFHPGLLCWADRVSRIGRAEPSASVPEGGGVV
ncbi:hypothetical protein LWC05_14890 [Acetobacter sicerae]|uniref:Uncharacterized protein n=1 Tax=Acetobacter sicerae TaxID=85325 RepID=A0ABS8W0S2_9PROT|nr:hypothetical protein [Acetobacter sicerae]MCE0745160.1 hypothetical protein [Acetobacter sicerae]